MDVLQLDVVVAVGPCLHLLPDDLIGHLPLTFPPVQFDALVSVLAEVACVQGHLFRDLAHDVHQGDGHDGVIGVFSPDLDRALSAVAGDGDVCFVCHGSVVVVVRRGKPNGSEWIPQYPRPTL